MEYVKAFLVGGVLCLFGQILMDKTKLTPARILVSYVVAGVFLSAVGLYKPLAEFAGAGATVPLTGFGYTLANVLKAIILNIEGEKKEQMYRELAVMREERHKENETA